VAGATDGDFDPENWWEKRVSIKNFTRELAGMAETIWELRNYPKPAPSAANPAYYFHPAFPFKTESLCTA
jgi:hypothetical protein